MQNPAVDFPPTVPHLIDIIDDMSTKKWPSRFTTTMTWNSHHYHTTYRHHQGLETHAFRAIGVFFFFSFSFFALLNNYLQFTISYVYRNLNDDERLPTSHTAATPPHHLLDVSLRRVRDLASRSYSLKNSLCCKHLFRVEGITLFLFVCQCLGASVFDKSRMHLDCVLALKIEAEWHDQANRCVRIIMSLMFAYD
jgi:hypothetical protein